MRALCLRWLRHRPLCCFLLMGASFFLFAVLSLNLAFLLSRNVEVWLAAGWQAAMDGALQQSLELLLWGYGAMLAYLLFKLCEKLLVDHLCRDEGAEGEPGRVGKGREAVPTARGRDRR